MEHENYNEVNMEENQEEKDGTMQGEINKQNELKQDPSCHIKGCNKTPIEQPIEVAIYSPETRYFEILTCRSHMPHVTKQWFEIDKTINYLWELMGKNPLSKWELYPLSFCDKTILGAAETMLKYINMLMNEITLTYEQSLQPNIIQFDKVIIESNLTMCSHILSERMTRANATKTENKQTW